MARVSAFAAANRKARQEAMRQKISDMNLLRQLGEILQAMESSEMTANDVARLKARADINLKLISKILPDEKYIEIEANVTSHEAALEALENVVGAGAEDTDDTEG